MDATNKHLFTRTDYVDLSSRLAENLSQYEDFNIYPQSPRGHTINLRYDDVEYTIQPQIVDGEQIRILISENAEVDNTIGIYGKNISNISKQIYQDLTGCSHLDVFFSQISNLLDSKQNHPPKEDMREAYDLVNTGFDRSADSDLTQIKLNEVEFEKNEQWTSEVETRVEELEKELGLN